MTTIIGGAHATNYHQNVIQFREIDYLFRGESDLAFKTFLEEWAAATPDWTKVKGLCYRQNGTVMGNEMEREANLI